MKHLLLTLFAFLTLTATAQNDSLQATVQSVPIEQTTPQQPAKYLFGYLSYKAAFESMPEYSTVQKQMKELREKYEAEAKHNQSEFNQKYEDFIAGQRDFPQTILEKRQSELEELMAKNTAFRDESRRLLKAAEEDTYAPLHDKLKAVLKLVGEREGFAFILNTDDNACPYVNAAQGKDINKLVQDTLK